MTLNSSRFAPANLDQNADVPGFTELVEKLKEDDKQRIDFLKACLLKLGLQVSENDNVVPSISRLHISSVLPTGASELMASLHEIISTKDGEEYIKDENDTFHLEKPSAWSLGSVAGALPTPDGEKTDNSSVDEDGIIDYNAVLKRVVVHEDNLPTSKDTPYFNHHAFFANLRHYRSKWPENDEPFGEHILYGEVVTSTNTMLEKYCISPCVCPITLMLTKLETRNCFDVFPAVSLPLRPFRFRDVAAAQTSGFPQLVP